MIQIVIDTDCVSSLHYNLSWGKDILHACNIIIPTTVVYEFVEKTLTELKKAYSVSIVELKDIDLVADFIYKRTQNKEDKISYKKRPTSKVRHKGECEMAVVAKKKDCFFVTRETKNINIFKRLGVKILTLKELGKLILIDKYNQSDRYDEYLASLKKFLHIF